MILHCVLVKFKPETSPETAEAALGELRALVGRIPGLREFSSGAYSSSEGLNRGYTHAFLMTFDTAAHRDAYLAHPDHAAAAAKVLPHVEGGVDGVLAFDWET